ncbi:PQQ-binding-like beta-propeller repeat protein [Streptomyces formicae]|uniref:Uncharacterized protein n=1 Tax=Streptomyces formicae TaxID=1616117 RepID=A0A291QHJ3_9ACTN|nr:PQQ-binding-like beta-propeller repeat protein [Streptomyces formicae]ATL31189.1 hypothetical protein KY5_6171 [Streptomyces formicae]
MRQPPLPPVGRRQLLLAGGAVGLAAASASLLTGQAHASPTRTRGATITDLGPAIEQFALMSAVLVGDTVYIGSRNLSPTRLIAFHLPTRKVVSRTDLGTGHSVQALAADPTGRYLYAGVLTKADEGRPNLFRWDLRSPDEAAVGIGRTEDRDVRELAVAPDGTVYAVGGVPGKAPALWRYDPGTGKVTGLGVPDPKATLARAVAATDTTVFFGAGSVLGGGGGASRASLYAYDRAAGTFTDITPPELKKDPSIRELAVFGDRLVVSTSASTGRAQLAVMDLADLTSFSVTPTDGTVAKNLTSDGDLVHFAGDAGLSSYSMATRTITPLAYDGPDLGEIWGLDHTDGALVVVSGYGFVGEIDTASGASVITELGPAGAPVSPQTAMGIAAEGRYVYVGGNNVVARHDLRRPGKAANLRAPGEAKDAEVLDGVLYTGQYNAQGIWAYDPADDEQPHQVARFPSEQNRPLDLCYDAVNELMLVGVQSDTEGGGSLWTYAPKTGEKSAFVDPVDETQLVRAVATRDGVAYLGGDNPTTKGPRGTLVAFDPVAGREHWRVDLPLSTGVAALAVRGRHLYGLTRSGGFFVVDLTIRRVIHTADLHDICPGFAAMVTSGGVVYGVSDTTLFRFHPKTFAVSTVVPGINGAWYSGPHVNADSRGRLYTLRGHHLVRIEDRPEV